MKSLDDALSSAFREFRKARPVRKNNNKLPKDQTALMHFRLRCLDLIEVLAGKEIGVDLAVATLLPLLSLLEATVKEPLQKPLMNRTRWIHLFDLEWLLIYVNCMVIVQDCVAQSNEHSSILWLVKGEYWSACQITSDSVFETLCQ